VYNDLGSGSNVDLCIITADGVEYLRNHEMLQGKTYSRQFPVRYPPGTARESRQQQGGWGDTSTGVSHSDTSACLQALFVAYARSVCEPDAVFLH
jgi:hypothetical protein